MDDLRSIVDVNTGKMIAAAGGSFAVWATNAEYAFKAGAAAILLAYMALRFYREWKKGK